MEVISAVWIISNRVPLFHRPRVPDPAGTRRPNCSLDFSVVRNGVARLKALNEVPRRSFRLFFSLV